MIETFLAKLSALILFCIVLSLPFSEAIAGTTGTKIARCKGLKIEAETDLERTVAIEIYVEDEAAEQTTYNDFEVSVRKAASAIELKQNELPTTTLKLADKKVTISVKEGPEKTYEACQFDPRGISVLKGAAKLNGKPQ